MEAKYDGIIVGAGHNGLITQAYLCRAGLKVISLDSAGVAGGGLATVEDRAHPGFFYNPHSYFHRGMTNMPWFKDLELAKHGVEYLDTETYVSILHRDGGVLQWSNDFERTYRSLATINKHDAGKLRYWRDRFVPIVRDILRPEAASIPLPEQRRRELLEKTEDGRLLLKLSSMSPYEFVKSEFEHPAIQGGLLFINGMREVDLRAKGFGHHIASLFATPAKVQTCRGGAASLAKALVRAVEVAGGTVRTNADVARILIEGGKAVGVELKNGEILRASRFVASSLNPHLTYLDLLDRKYLPEEWKSKVDNFKYNVLGPLFAIFLNLREPPIYRASDTHPDVQQSLMVIMGIDHIDQFLQLVENHDRGVIGPSVLWGGTPTALDPSQAPAGKHTAFMWEKTPYRLRGDPYNWISEKESQAQRMFDLWAEYAPNLRSATISRRAQTPQEVPIDNPNMREADVLMGAFTNGQVGINRPFAGAGEYRTHVPGLYLCGSASHPGGNITGLPGYVAAGEILKDQQLIAGGGAKAGVA